MAGVIIVNLARRGLLNEQTLSKVQVMRGKEHTYIEDDFFTGFVKPYKDSNYAFMALLPKKAKDFSFLCDALDQIDFSKLLKAAYHCEVNTAIPEFECDFEMEMKEFCEEFGIYTLFSKDADFSRMSCKNLKAGSIIHKARIIVDQKGTQAIAITMMTSVKSLSVQMPKTVILNRPFIYAILNIKTGFPVFTGIYNYADK